MPLQFVAQGPMLIPTGNDAYTTAWANVVASRGSAPSVTVRTQVDTLVTALKSSFGATLENSFLRFWLLANFDNNEHGSFTSLINPSSTEMTKSGSFTSTTLGYLSDGSTGFINTQFTPSTDHGSIMTTSGYSYGIYDLSNITSALPNDAVLGADDGANRDHMFTRFGGGGGQGLACLGNVTNFTANQEDTRALHVAIRESSTNCRYDQINAIQDHGTSTNTGAATLVTIPIYLCAHNSSNVADLFSANKIAFAFIGKTFATTDSDNLSTAINAYMTSLGINVY